MCLISWAEFSNVVTKTILSLYPHGFYSQIGSNKWTSAVAEILGTAGKVFPNVPCC